MAISAMRTNPPMVPPTAPPITAVWTFELLPLLLLTSPTAATEDVTVCGETDRDAVTVREIRGGAREYDGVGDAELVCEGEALMTAGGTVSAKPRGDPGRAE